MGTGFRILFRRVTGWEAGKKGLGTGRVVSPHSVLYMEGDRGVHIESS